MFLWWDATVCQHDWLLCQVDAVKDSNIVKVHHLLQGFCSASGHDELRVAQAKEASDLIRVHSFLPVVVGFRHSDLASKISGMLFAIALESNSLEELANKLNNIVSVTSDMGTESGATDFHCDNLHQLLPSWFLPLEINTGILGEPDAVSQDTRPGMRCGS